MTKPRTPQERIVELHDLAREDYASTANLRQGNTRWPLPAEDIATLTAQYNELDTAIRVAQQLLDSGSTLSLREALRALDADEDARRFVARHFPTVAAFLDDSDQPSQADEALRRARQNGGGQ